MARLFVEAIVTGRVVRSGTRDPAWMTVSVTRADGQPVSTLTAANFTIGTTFSSSRVDVSLFSGGSLQIGPGATNAGGLYAIELVPIAGANWGPLSSYHLVVVISDRSNHGQTIVELTLAP